LPAAAAGAGAAAGGGGGGLSAVTGAAAAAGAGAGAAAAAGAAATPRVDCVRWTFLLRSAGVSSSTYMAIQKAVAISLWVSTGLVNFSSSATQSLLGLTIVTLSDARSCLAAPTRPSLMRRCTLGVVLV
jgi:hypothetical protein